MNFQLRVVSAADFNGDPVPTPDTMRWAHDFTRCRACRPYSNPRPLTFGAEYHRRQKRRNR